MKCSIEEIPKTLMDICKNLLSRRALIVELLESVTKSEIDMNQVSPKIESLKVPKKKKTIKIMAKSFLARRSTVATVLRRDNRRTRAEN